MAAPGPRFLELKQDIARDKGRELALLQGALNAGPALASDERLWVLVQLSKASRKANKSDDALNYLRQAQREAATLPIGQAYATRHLIELLTVLDRRQEAMAEYLKIAPTLPSLSGTLGTLDGQLEAAEVQLVGATVMSSLGQLAEAMDLLLRALAVFDAHDGQAAGQSKCLSQIANLHFKGGNLDAALRDIQRAIDIAEQAKAYEVLARLYMRKGVILSSKGEVEANHQALMRARTFAEAENDAYNMSLIATNLSDVALQRKDYKAAIRFADEAIPLVEKSGDREAWLICRVNKGIALNRLGRPEGLVLLRNAIDEFSATAGKKHVAADLQGNLSEELAFNRDYEKAYLAALDFKMRSDEVRQANDQKRIADSAARYQADKKQRQIELLEQEQRSQRRMQWLWALAGGLGILTAAILVVSRVYLKRAYRTVEEMSLSDPLTGLRNRRYLASRIAGDLAQAVRQRFTLERAQQIPAAETADLVFIMLDMDHFKSVNDVHGHAAGDAVLRQFSAILTDELRDSDTVVRWGGEEFVIVAKQTSCAEIHLLAERLRARVASHRFDIGNGAFINKTCSIGYASYPFAPAELPQPRWEDVVDLADQCMYAAKASGRDMWVGIVPNGLVQSMPREGDVRLGLCDGVVRLEHRGGRDVSWPEGAGTPSGSEATH